MLQPSLQYIWVSFIVHYANPYNPSAISRNLLSLVNKFPYLYPWWILSNLIVNRCYILHSLDELSMSLPTVHIDIQTSIFFFHIFLSQQSLNHDLLQSACNQKESERLIHLVLVYVYVSLSLAQKLPSNCINLHLLQVYLMANIY